MLALWAVGAAIVSNDIVLPTPGRVLAVFSQEVLGAGALARLGGTAARVFLAFALGSLIGAGVGVAAVWRPGGSAVVAPVLVVLQAVPAVAFILLAMIWFPTDVAPVAVATLLIIPLVASGVRSGHAARDSNLLEMADAFGLTARQRFAEITLRAALPAIGSALRVSLGLSWKAVIAAEVIIEPAQALGTELQLARLNLDTHLVFAWILLAVIASGLTDAAWSLGGRLFLRSNKGEKGSAARHAEQARAV